MFADLGGSRSVLEGIVCADVSDLTRGQSPVHSTVHSQSSNCKLGIERCIEQSRIQINSVEVILDGYVWKNLDIRYHPKTYGRIHDMLIEFSTETLDDGDRASSD